MQREKNHTLQCCPSRSWWGCLFPSRWGCAHWESHSDCTKRWWGQFIFLIVFGAAVPHGCLILFSMLFTPFRCSVCSLSFAVSCRKQGLWALQIAAVAVSAQCIWAPGITLWQCNRCKQAKLHREQETAVSIWFWGKWVSKENILLSAPRHFNTMWKANIEYRVQLALL